MKYAIGAILGIALFAWLFSLCSPAGKNKTGHEYMPDMYHPVATRPTSTVHITGTTGMKESVLSKAELSQPHGKVKVPLHAAMTAVYYDGSICHGCVRGKNASNAIAAPVNGEAPFYYENTEEDRLRCEAGNERTIHFRLQKQDLIAPNHCIIFIAAFATVKKATAKAGWPRCPIPNTLPNLKT
jgi:hypothetical protein